MAYDPWTWLFKDIYLLAFRLLFMQHLQAVDIFFLSEPFNLIIFSQEPKHYGLLEPIFVFVETRDVLISQLFHSL